jgi:hypothetical protein
VNWLLAVTDSSDGFAVNAWRHSIFGTESKLSDTFVKITLNEKQI